MTLNEALAVKARGLTKEQIIAHLRAVAENNLRADIRTIERAWKEKPSGLEGKTVKQSRNTGTFGGSYWEDRRDLPPGTDLAPGKWMTQKGYHAYQNLICRRGNKRWAATVSLVTETLLRGVVRSARSTRFKENVNANRVSPGSPGICRRDCSLWAEQEASLR
jgi:hypothetical protein